MHSRRPQVAHSSAYHSSIHTPPLSPASSPPATLHKRAPLSPNLPPPACFQQIYNTYSHPSSHSSSSSQPTPPMPNPRQLHDLQPLAHQHQGNKLRKVMHNGDSHMIGPSFHDPDKLVHLANDGTLPTDVNSPPPRSATATNPQAPSLPSTTYNIALSTKGPQRPEPIHQQSYSKRHASFDTPRTEVPLPFFSEPFLKRHQ